MIVDDRIAIIGSANINERSQRGDRDSELACIIRDTDMIDSQMAGQPYQVGRFAHTMRVRLMREHLGVNVDELEANEGKAEFEAREADELIHREAEWDPDHQQSHGTNRGVKGGKTSRFIRSMAGRGAQYVSATTSGAAEAGSVALQRGGVKVKNTAIPSQEGHNNDADEPEGAESGQETKADKIAAGEAKGPGFASTVVPTIEEKVMSEDRPPPDEQMQGDIREGNEHQPANIERKNGVATHNPRQQREEEEEEQDGNFGQHIPKLRPPPSKADEGPTGEHRQQPMGQDFSQENPETDDTRKLVSGADRSGIADDAPRNAEPADVANADQGYHKLDANNKHDSEGAKVTGEVEADDGAASPRKTRKADGNEKAVSRNDVTEKVKRNLRERGPYTVPLPAPKVDPYGFADPLVDEFYKDVWLAAAARNTQIYRKVFRTMPDDLVQTWKQYREFQVSPSDHPTLVSWRSQ